MAIADYQSLMMLVLTLASTGEISVAITAELMIEHTVGAHSSCVLELKRLDQVSFSDD